MDAEHYDIVDADTEGETLMFQDNADRKVGLSAIFSQAVFMLGKVRGYFTWGALISAVALLFNVWITLILNEQCFDRPNIITVIIYIMIGMQSLLVVLFPLLDFTLYDIKGLLTAGMNLQLLFNKYLNAQRALKEMKSAGKSAEDREKYIDDLKSTKTEKFTEIEGRIYYSRCLKFMDKEQCNFYLNTEHVIIRPFVATIFYLTHLAGVVVHISCWMWFIIDYVMYHENTDWDWFYAGLIGVNFIFGVLWIFFVLGGLVYMYSSFLPMARAVQHSYKTKNFNLPEILKKTSTLVDRL